MLCSQMAIRSPFRWTAVVPLSLEQTSVHGYRFPISPSLGFQRPAECKEATFLCPLYTNLEICQSLVPANATPRSRNLANLDGCRVVVSIGAYHEQNAGRQWRRLISAASSLHPYFIARHPRHDQLESLLLVRECVSAITLESTYELR